MKLPIVLRIYKDDELVDVKQSTSSQVVVGNGGEVDIQLNHESVSPLHMVIEERDDGYFVTDLGSQSGTLLNGEKILDSRIESGESLQIGEYKIDFYVGVPKPKKPEAPPKADPGEITAVVDVTTGPDELTQELDLKDQMDADDDLQLTVNENAHDVEPPKVVKEPIQKPKIPSKAPRSVESVVGSGTVATPAQSAKGSFAPPGAIKNIEEVVKPGIGSIVEVLVTWNNKVIDTYQCDGQTDVFLGSGDDCEVNMPLSMSEHRKYKFISFTNGAATVHISNEMSGSIVTKKGSKPFEDIRVEMAAGNRPIDITLNQGEMLKVTFPYDGVTIFVRYGTETAKPILAPLLDMTATELTSLVFAALVGVIFSLYMFVYSPELSGEDKKDEPLRKAVVTFKPPSPPKPPKPPKPKKKELIKVSNKKKAGKKSIKKRASTRKKSGRAAELAPNKKKRKTRKKLVSSNRPGGAKKVGNKKGSGAKSKKPDVSKSGLFSAFGKKGLQDKLSKVFDGAGGVAGLADSATGSSGQNEDRAGVGLGTKLKNTGASGKGAKTIGISGVGTKGGRGSGLSGSGEGGFGERARVNIAIGGEEAFFEGSIDKEAVRRVILANRSSWRHCYNIGLRSNSSLSGKVKVSWIITEGGKVRKAKVEKGITKNRQIGNCIVRRLRNLKFPEPPPDKEALVEYPFVFTSK